MTNNILAPKKMLFFIVIVMTFEPMLFIVTKAKLNLSIDTSNSQSSNKKNTHKKLF